MTPANRICFLSVESFRGPLTINVIGKLPQIALGQTVRLEGDEIAFPNNARLHLGEARSWTPPPPPCHLLSKGGQAKTIHAVAEIIMTHKPQAGLAPLLGSLLDIPFPPLPTELRPAQACLDAFQDSADEQELLPLLGLGGGLTPSGDDFIAGYLLASVRARLPHAAVLSAAAAAQAQARTTALSAGLIAAAAAGSADERLIQAFDAIFYGGLPSESIFDLLTNYGSSSGLDAFVGLVTAFYSLTARNIYA
jgi:hypothetical protein